MGSKSLVICDPEENYAKALGLYIANRSGVSFQVQVCSKIEHVKKADLLLISDSYSEDERRKVQAEKEFLLSERVLEDCSAICKYQSGEAILEEVLEQCETVYKQEELFYSPFQKKNGRIIGIFSPVHRIGKTSYALELGEKLAATENVLYLNLELYGGIGGHFEKGCQTLEDVLYYARQEKGNLGFMLAKAVRKRGGLDYVLPIPVSEDIKEIKVQEWIRLLEQIIKQSVYETIILDIDEGLREVYELLKVCTQVYLLEDDSEYSRAKIEQFERELTVLGYEEVLAKIVRRGEEI